MKRILVWDVPTRLFHWLFATSFAGAWLTSESDEWLSLHAFFGYLMLGLIGFRLVWGVTGGHYARFSSFAYSPMAGLAHLRKAIAGDDPRHVGHNPAGSQAIFLLLGLGLVTCLSGVLVQGGEEQQGVAAGWVGHALGNIIKEGHDLAATLMLLVAAGHVVVGVALESWRHKINLPRTMVTGMKDAAEGTPASRPYRVVGALLLAAAVAFAVWWFFYALDKTLDKHVGREKAAAEGPHVAFVGPALAGDPKWREECGSCHLAFHPSLLPARSWKKLIADQEQHFGEDLALDEPTRAALLAFAASNAAEQHATEAAFKIHGSVKAEDTPLRITQTPYWIKKHRDIAASDWLLPQVKSKMNCAACHQDAEAGTFEDAAMRIPRQAPANEPLHDGRPGPDRNAGHGQLLR